MAYSVDGTIGVNLAERTTELNAVLGQTTRATDGSIWTYVQANGAVTAYDCVCIDENFQAAACTKALVDAGHGIGFAQAAFADNEYGWVATHAPGNASVRVAASCAADVQLYTTATAGVLDDTSASQTIIRGVVLVAAGTSGGVSARECIAVYPNGTATP